MEKAGDIAQKLAKLTANIAARRASEVPAPAAQNLAPVPVPQLPLWPDLARGVPNTVLRSALFGAIKRGSRPFLERHRVAAVEGTSIFFTGQRMDQGDLDVWETILHAARVQALGAQCKLTAYSLLKSLGKSDTGGNRTVLHKRITRLRGGTVEITNGLYTYGGGLVDEFYKDEVSQEYVIVLNPRIQKLFHPDQFTLVDWSIRRALSGKPLAQWLHGFYASHAKPYALNVATLHELCGSEAARLDHFRQDLRKGLDALHDASAANGQRFDYRIVGDLVHVERSGSRAQQRHTEKRTRRKAAA